MPQTDIATKPETAAVTAVTPPRRRARLSPRVRALLAAGSVLSGCALWFFAFGKIGAAYEALPWYVALASIGVVCALRAARPVIEETPLLSLLPASAQQQPMSLLESWAITYFLASVMLYAFVALQALLPHDTNRRMVQFVEIRLESAHDFANRNSPLPGTEEQQELHKREADRLTRQGATDSHRVAEMARHSQPAPQRQTGDNKEQRQPARASQPRREQLPARHQSTLGRTASGVLPAMQPLISQAQDMILIKPATASAAASASGKRSASGKQTGEQPYLEEVQPPELVEMIENDGIRQSANVFEAGGNSEGGTGAANDLTVYLKELHERIKNLWSPPRGQSHRAAVLFRIRKEGRLAFIKLVRSSGDADTDNAAVKAIAGAVKGLRLPESSKLPFLDVQYTFNYTADELNEVGQPSPPDDDLL